MLERYLAPTPWSSERPETLVVCCSDGRWHAQVHEFVRAVVSERPDLYAVPGGAVALDLWNSSLEEAWSAEKSFRFLARHHQLRSVWLIAHEGCAYYRTRVGPLPEADLRRRQEEDLLRAEDNLCRWLPGLKVSLVYASLENDRVVFDRAPAGLDERAEAVEDLAERPASEGRP